MDHWPFRRPLITPLGWVGIGCVGFWAAVCWLLWMVIR